MKVSLNDVRDLIKLVTEPGGCYALDDNNCIYDPESKEPVRINVNRVGRAIMVVHRRMKLGEAIGLNPFAETKVPSAELTWFYKTIMEKLPCNLFHSMLYAVARHVQDAGKDKEDTSASLAFLEMASKLGAECNKSTLKQLKRIPLDDILRVHYDRDLKIIQLQTDMFNDEYREKYPKKEVSDKTWKFVQNFILEIFGEDIKVSYTEVEDKDESEWPAYLIKSQLIAIPGCELRFKLANLMYGVMEPYLKALSNIKIDMEEFDKHVTRLDAYLDISDYMVTRTVEEDEEEPVRKSRIPTPDEPSRTRRVPMPDGYEREDRYERRSGVPLPEDYGLRDNDSYYTRNRGGSSSRRDRDRDRRGGRGGLLDADERDDRRGRGSRDRDRDRGRFSLRRGRR